MRFIVETFPIFYIYNELLKLLTSWKKQQKYEMAKFGIISNPEQFIFTYIDTKGNINKPLHSDYLNNKMKTIRKRHPELTHATPHKLRHTDILKISRVILGQILGQTVLESIEKSTHRANL